jgi:hypothetical protein
MKMLTEYLDRAIEFEKLAASEQDEALKAALFKQADSYRSLAAKRAETIRTSNAERAGKRGALIQINAATRNQAHRTSWRGTTGLTNCLWRAPWQ